MMKYSKRIIFYILTNLLVLRNVAQTPMLDPIQKQFTEYQQDRLQEKVYLHTDKEFYLAGEICWFKLYDVDAYFHLPLDFSKVAYVEIIDRNNKPVLQLKLALRNGLGNGSWDLPVNLSSGNYKIRAYTSLMKNSLPDYYFEKFITIINPNKALGVDTAIVNSNAGIRFYPEGGNLVNGIQSKLAFRMFDRNGKGLNAEGTIVSSAGETVLKFSPKTFGIGSFQFTPKAGQNYLAKLTLPDGTIVQQDLPSAFNEGWVMRVDQNNEKQLKVTVISSGRESADVPVFLFTHTRNTMQQVLRGSFQNGQAVFMVNKNNLGEGVSQFTVFNSLGNPICERLYFRYPEKSLELSINSEQKSYNQREKVSLQVSSGGKAGMPVSANLSMAVYLIDSLQGITDADIKNYLWLSADLAGVVESPGYYFENNGIGKEDATDNLMLTHGWRRFRWEDVLQHKKPVLEFIPEYAGHIVTGKVTVKATGLPAKDIDCFLSVTGSQTQFRNSSSDSAGVIRFDLGEFYNDGELIIQPNSLQDSIYNIEILKPYSEKYSTSTVPGFAFSTGYTGMLSNHYGNLQVSNTYTGNLQKQFLFPKVDTSAFYLKPDITYLLDNYVRFTTMEEVLREYVAPINVRKHSDGFHLYIFDKTRNETFTTEPLILLDGVPVFNTDKFMQYDPLKIRQLDVVSQGYYLGSMSYTGVANFITYSKDLQGLELDPHTTVIDYDGLQLQREFYAPDYTSPQQLASRLPDFRNLLYWNPDINTSESGKNEVSFFSSDLPGKYVVVVQGLSKDGKAGSGLAFFEIKSK